MLNRFLASTELHSSSDRGSDVSDSDSDVSDSQRSKGGEEENGVEDFEVGDGMGGGLGDVGDGGPSSATVRRLKPIEGASPMKSSPPPIVRVSKRRSPPLPPIPMAPPRYAPELRWGAVLPLTVAAGLSGTSMRGSSGFSGNLSLQYPAPFESGHLQAVALDRAGNKVQGHCVYFAQRDGASVVLPRGDGDGDGEAGGEEKGRDEVESVVVTPGTVLVPGLWVLQCLFVPRDTMLYTSVEGAVASVVVEKGVCEVSFLPPSGSLIAGTPLGPAYFNAEAGVRTALPFSPYRGLRAREAERARLRAEEAEAERVRRLILGLEVEGRDTDKVDDLEEEEGGDESKGWLDHGEEEEREDKGEGADDGDDGASAHTSKTADTIHPPLRPVPGRFDYSHAPGAVLSKGTHTLVVKFTPAPSHAALFRPSYARAHVTVGPPMPDLLWPALPALYFNTPLGPSQLRCVLSPDPAVPSFVAKKKDAWSIKNAPQPQGAHALKEEEEVEEVDEGGADRSIEERLQSVGTFTYWPPEGSLLPIGQHTLSVSFCPHSDRYYSPASRTQTLTVIMAQPTLRWPTPPPLYLGDGLDRRHLSCATEPAVEGSFVYTPPLGEALPEGQHALRCLFLPADPKGYHPAEASVVLLVHRKKAVTVYWSQPRPLVYPAPLTRLELSASVTTAGVRGTFEYDPPLGTVLDATELDEEQEEEEERSGGEVVEEVGVADGETTETKEGGNGVPAKRRRPVEVLHTLTATFRSESKAFIDTTATVSVRVFRGMPRLVWPALSALIEGEILQSTSLCCRCLNLDKGLWLYEPPPLTQLLNGYHSLTVIFTPAPEDRRNWRTASCATTLTVNKRQKRRTKVVWPGPLAPIRHPQKLSREQCCATSPTCDGSFYYSPPIGAILDVGTYNLKVTFMPAQSKLYAPSDALQSLTVLQGTAALLWQPDPALCLLPYGLPLPGALLCASSDAQGDVTYSPAEGAVLDSGEYLLKATLTPHYSGNFLPATATCPLKVTRHTPLLQWDPLPAVTYPTILTDEYFQPRLVFPPDVFPPLAAEGLAKGKFKFSHKVGDTPQVGRHTLKCRYTPADDINFYAAECRVRLEVGKGSPFVYRWHCAESLVFGEPLSEEEHLNADFDMDPSQVDVRYDPPPGHLFDSVGFKTITLKLMPHDVHNYLPLSLSRTIAVEKQATPIRWATPSPIQYGTRLGSRQLCAEIDTACLDPAQRADLLGPEGGAARGEFRYSPAAGTVLEVGKNHLLTVVFHPSEAVANFRASNTLRVLLEVKRSAAKLSAQPAKGITYGTPLQAKHVSATVRNADAHDASVPLQGTLVFQPVLGTVLPPGTHAISLSFSPTNPTNAAPDSLRVYIDVYRAIPELRWPAFKILRTVRAGYRLTQDDCTATALGVGNSRVAGQFFYTPPAGTVLVNSGLRELTAEFIPTAAAQQLYYKPPPLVVKVQVQK